MVAGENTTCTFTNTKLGSITIVKNTVGGDGTFHEVVNGLMQARAGGEGTGRVLGIGPERPSAYGRGQCRAGHDLCDLIARCRREPQIQPISSRLQSRGLTARRVEPSPRTAVESVLALANAVGAGKSRSMVTARLLGRMLRYSGRAVRARSQDGGEPAIEAAIEARRKLRRYGYSDLRHRACA